MSKSREIDRICDEFEAAWQAGQQPIMEEYAARIEEEHRPALYAALMPLDLTYRGKLGETVDSAPVADAAKAFDVTVESDANGPDLSASLATGDKERVKYFGEYQLLSEIARGGMGVVYKARQVKLNRIVALKMILSGEFAGSEAVKRFHSEAEAAANLDHPGIVPIYEIGEHAGQHYFSMGFIDGPSLQGKLSAGPMPAKDAARLCRKIAEAVAYAHSKNVIHRDLKPANVLIDGNGEPKVTDFGLAKKVEGDSGLTRTGAVMGTPSYMPPEQALGQTERIGPASDIYSLGAILYCMLTGRPPFQAANVVETLKQVLENAPIPVRLLSPNVDTDLETVCMKCLEKNPGNRYETAIRFAEDLDRYLQGEAVHAKSLSLVKRIARTLQRGKHDVELKTWSTMLYWFAAIAMLSEIGMYFYAIGGPPYLKGWAIAIRASQFTAMGVVLLTYRNRWTMATGPAIKQMLSIWVGFLIACHITLFSFMLTDSAGIVRDELRVYPFLATLSGLTLFVMGASYWGALLFTGNWILCLGVTNAVKATVVTNRIWTGMDDQSHINCHPTTPSCDHLLKESMIHASRILNSRLATTGDAQLRNRSGSTCTICSTGHRA